MVIQWVTNRFMGLNLIESEPGMEVHNIVQKVVTKAIPKKKMQEGKVVVRGGFTNS